MASDDDVEPLSRVMMVRLLFCAKKKHEECTILCVLNLVPPTRSYICWRRVKDVWTATGESRVSGQLEES